MHFIVGHEGGQEDTDDIWPSSSCSSPGGKSYDGDEYSCSLEIADDFGFDGEVGKRLIHMTSIPVSIAYFKAIPSLYGLCIEDRL